uniref:Ribonuclease H-like domain-containing protein n=1 Tax=Tanacetum cinerariifolium TaxID=118510 RepID=A0A699ICS0_TANCI|nr:ribonuclease H-like domain-containing protein [Tanacetum cinerariifolium]
MHHHLLTRVLVKLDLDNWNFGSWEFFEQLCATYDVEKYIHIPAIESSTTSPVVARPKYAKEAWGLIYDVIKDNKRSRANALKAELCSIILGDQSMESYFQKIDSIVTILTSLDAGVNDEDMVYYELEGLLDKYNQVCGYMHWKETFLDLKVVRSLLIAEEMILKSKALALPVDSSSLMVLVVESSTNSCSSMSQGTSLGPNPTPPPGFSPLAQAHLLYYGYIAATPAHLTPPAVGPVHTTMASTGDLYLVTAPSSIPSAFLVSLQTWHQRLGHPGSKVMRRLVSNNVISCNKEKPLVLCHACLLGKHVWLPFVCSNFHTPK